MAVLQWLVVVAINWIGIAYGMANVGFIKFYFKGFFIKRPCIFMLSQNDPIFFYFINASLN